LPDKPARVALGDDLWLAANLGFLPDELAEELGCGYAAL
jgi:hypothetical protein